MTANQSLDEVLTRHHVGLTVEEFLAELDAGLSRVSNPAAAPLTASEMGFLQQHGGLIAAEVRRADPDELEAEAADAATRQVSEAVQQSVSIAEAALLLGVDRSRVSQRLSSGSLWGFRLGRTIRLPRWQFTADGGVLPGLAAVVTTIPAGLAPATLAGFMTTPQPEFDDLTPIGYLASGGDAGRVAELLESLGQW